MYGSVGGIRGRWDWVGGLVVDMVDMVGDLGWGGNGSLGWFGADPMLWDLGADDETGAIEYAVSVA